jgi:heme-degrading monooxygenase HmoA
MIATIWRFRVNPDSIAAFERVYGPHGDWARLFARATGYAGTELLKLDGEAETYLTIDRWHGEADYHAARTLLAADYAALDRASEAFTSGETWLGLHTLIE